MSSVLKAALLMFLYAVCLLAIGWATYMVAPPGAHALTAFIVPAIAAAIMIFCAIGTLMIGSNRLFGMLGIHVGLVIPLLFALAVGAGRMPKSFNAAGAFNQAIEASDSGVIVAKERKEGSVHPAGYQAVGMGAMVALSGFAFVALLLQRPKVPKKEAPAAAPVGESRPYVDDGE